MEIYFLQKCFQLHGLAIKDMFTRFNEYMGASLLGNKGQLFVLETTERTRALFLSKNKDEATSIPQTATCGKTVIAADNAARSIW